MPILQGRSQEPYTEEQKEWQALRHGRYVEFNLVYDRGTKFGFTVPNVKIESVLMSLPLTVRFEYRMNRRRVVLRGSSSIRCVARRETGLDMNLIFFFFEGKLTY